MSNNGSKKALDEVRGKTAIVTGGANGIGLAVIRDFHSRGANVVIADLPGSEENARAIIDGLEGGSSRAAFVPANVTSWDSMNQLFRSTIEKFGKVDIVVANAGIMESRRFFDFEVDDQNMLKEDTGFGRVIDVNLKGTMNTLRQAVFYLSQNTPDANGWRGSVVLVSSSSGYIGGTEVTAYVSSKHGITGLLRSTHASASRLGVRVNSIAPFITSTYITKGYSEKWAEKNLPMNTTEDVAREIIEMSLDPSQQGKCNMVAGGEPTEVEGAIIGNLAGWAGQSLANIFSQAKTFFQSINGYPLPPERT